jgi:hypothetical protein
MIFGLALGLFTPITGVGNFLSALHWQFWVGMIIGLAAGYLTLATLFLAFLLFLFFEEQRGRESRSESVHKELKKNELLTKWKM